MFWFFFPLLFGNVLDIQQILKKNFWDFSLGVENSLTTALPLVFDQRVKYTWRGLFETLSSFIINGNYLLVTFEWKSSVEN